MARAADDALIGRTIANKFVVESFIGGGAMGAVYKAKQLSLDKSVAIKVLHRDLVTDPTFIARFQREAKAASRLDHPNSMRVLDYGRDADGLCYIAMELLVGQGLFQLLREARGPLDPERTVALTRQILAPLAVAHEMGILHRDLKPENIIVVAAKGDDGEVSESVKVCDFGMAKMLENKSLRESHVEKLTSRGVVVGTPEYMSPEQGKGEELDARSDLYSVGVILYQMLTGKLPFSADTPIAILLKHIVEEPRPPSQIDPDVHPGLEAICLRAMKKSPADRFASAREMRTALRTALEPGVRTSHADIGPSLHEDSAPQVSTSTPFAAEYVGAPPNGAEPEGLAALGSTNPVPLRRKRALASLESVRPARQGSNALVFVVSGLVVLAAAAWVALRLRSATPEPTPLPRQAQATPVEARTEATTTPPPPSEPSVQAAASSGPAPPAASSMPNGLAAGARPLPAVPAPPPPVSPGRPTTAPSHTGAATPLPAPPPTAAPSAVTAAPPMPVAPAEPAPPGPFDKASVSMGSVRSKHAQSVDILAALPGGRFNQCYRDGLRVRGSGLRGSGTLHLVFGSDGHVGEAGFVGPSGFESIGQCVVGWVTGINIRNVEAGADGADIDLAFKPE